MGLDVVQAVGCDPVIVGVPETLEFKETTTDKRPRTLATLLRSTESLKFEEWQGQAAGQGWGKVEADVGGGAKVVEKWRFENPVMAG